MGPGDATTMALADKVESVPQFRGLQDNFLFWQARIKALLMEKGALNAIKTDAVSTDAERDAAAKACSIILRGLGDVPMAVVIKYIDSPKSMWEALAERYAGISTFNKASMQTALAKLRYTGCSMEEYVAKFEHLAAKLNAMGAPMDESMLITLFFQSFTTDAGAKYSAVIAALQTKETLTWVQASSRMLQEFEALRAMLDSSGDSEGATSSAGERALQAGVKHVVCWYCKKKGHKKSECRKRKADSKKNGSAHGSIERAHMARTKVTADALVDSGATCHIVNDGKLLRDKTEVVDTTIVTATDEVLKPSCSGKCALGLGGFKIDKIQLDRVLHVPEFTSNLLSVSQLCDDEYKVEFDKDAVLIKENGKVVGKGRRCGNAYIMPLMRIEGAMRAKSNIERAKPVKTKTAYSNALELWHQRMGHADKNAISRMASTSAVRGIDLTEKALEDVCGPCMEGKMTNGPMPLRTELCKVPGEVIHTDVAHINVPSLGGAKYFVTFLDEASGHITARAIKRKNDASTELIKYVAWIERQSGTRVKRITMDGADKTDYAQAVNKLSLEGVEFNPTAPYSPAENGRAERVNRTLNGTVRAMLSQAGLPEEFWAECLMTATQVRNCLPKADKKKSPEEELTSRVPSVAHFRVFGSLVWTRVADKKRRKLDPKAKRGVLLGSVSYGKYRVWLEKEAKVIVSRHCRVVETEFPALTWAKDKALKHRFTWTEEQEQVGVPTIEFDLPSGTSEPSQPAVGGAPSERSVAGGGEFAGEEEQHVIPESPELSEPEFEVPDEEESPAVDTSNAPAEAPVRRNPTRVRKPPVRFDEEFAGMALDKPITYVEAMGSDEKPKWKAALKEEMNAIMASGTLTTAKLPAERHAISTKFIFKRKLGVDGDVKRYKARLVVHGNLQKPGIDYEETYAPVVDWEVALTAISVMSRRNAHIDLVDFQTAFLNGDLEEEVYVRLPKAYDKSQKVYRLAKSLYGLKQSPRNWFKKLCSALRKFGFQEVKAADCIVTKGSGNDLVVLLVYVDDMVIMSESSAAVNKTKRDLQADFKITDLGPLKYFLGIKFERSSDGHSMRVTQEKYAERVLDRFGMANSRPVPTPMAANFLGSVGTGPKNDKEREDMSKHPYRAVLGCLLYLARHTRPDISFAVSLLCRYVQDPALHHWTAVKRLMRYVRGTTGFGLQVGAVKDKADYTIEAYVDADWAGEKSERKSTTGYLLKVHGACVAWRSVKQSITALSTAEAEYVAMSMCVRALARMRNLLEVLGDTVKTARVWEDNQPAIAWAEKGGMRTKHLDVRYHYVRDELHRGRIEISYCPTDRMQADALTKPVDADKLAQFVKDLLLSTKTSSTRRSVESADQAPPMLA